MNNNQKSEDQAKLIDSIKVSSDIKEVEYIKINVQDIKIKHIGREKGKDHYNATLDGKTVGINSRFWSSLGSKFKVNQRMFSLFSPDEVFERLALKEGADANVRLAVEKTERGTYGEMLAVSSLDKKIITYNEILPVLMSKGGKDLQYSNGVVTGTFKPASGEQAFDVGGDAFQHLYMAGVPIDGYGDPDLTLALERFVCANGMIGTGTGFTSKVNLGKDNPLHGMNRALDSYANEEGYEQLVNQIYLAQNTMASVAEANAVLKVVSRCNFNESAKGMLHKYQALTGNMLEVMGEPSYDALPVKFQQSIATKATIYDLLNFVTELMSHHAEKDSIRTLRALTGTMLSGYYDLEGVKPDEDREHQALFVGDKGDGFDDK